MAENVIAMVIEIESAKNLMPEIGIKYQHDMVSDNNGMPHVKDMCSGVWLLRPKPQTRVPSQQPSTSSSSSSASIWTRFRPQVIVCVGEM